MPVNVSEFRRLKWGAPGQKLRRPSGDVAPPRRSLAYPVLLVLVFAATFGIAYIFNG